MNGTERLRDLIAASSKVAVSGSDLHKILLGLTAIGPPART